MIRSKPVRLALYTVAVAALVYVVGFVWPAGGVRRQFGRLSGSEPHPAATGLTSDQVNEETQKRAESIRLAVLAFQRDRGALPPSLEALVPKYLPAVPEPLTSTLPFKLLVPKKGGFSIKWEAWPNAAYECYWIEQDGTIAGDM